MDDVYYKGEVMYPKGCTELLNHGFVKLVDSMGDDSSIVQAARVSYGKGTKKVNEDRGLIRYLMRHLHTTPFEMVEFKFHCRMPIFVARQWIRHRTANVNEYSGRYSEMPNLFYVPQVNHVTKQNPLNKQGGIAEEVDNSLKFCGEMNKEQQDSHQQYKKYLDSGMRKELARINLPLSQYTEWYWKIDLHNLFHFLKLRLDPHAQYEIRVFGEAMAEMVKEKVPLAWEAFEDYQHKSMKFSYKETQLIAKYLTNFLMKELPTEEQLNEEFKNKRESKEFLDKLNTFRFLNFNRDEEINE